MWWCKLTIRIKRIRQSCRKSTPKFVSVVIRETFIWILIDCYWITTKISNKWLQIKSSALLGFLYCICLEQLVYKKKTLYVKKNNFKTSFTTSRTLLSSQSCQQKVSINKSKLSLSKQSLHSISIIILRNNRYPLTISVSPFPASPLMTGL